MQLQVTPRIVIAALSLAAAPNFATAQSVTLLPISGGYDDSRVQALSFDGSAAAGLFGSNAGLQSPIGYSWTSAHGVSGLPLPPGALGFIAQAISHNGSTIAGTFALDTNQSNDRAFVATASGEYTDLGPLPHNYFQSRAEGISADGSAVVGFVQGSTDLDASEPMIWTAAGGIRTLGYLNQFDSYGKALAVSANGRVVVGETSSGGFVWTSTEGMYVPLTVPGIVDTLDRVVDVNPSGTIYIANGRQGLNRVVVRYTDGVPELLFGAARPFSFNVAGMSDDGSVIVGSLNASGGLLRPGIWTAETGVMELIDYVNLFGVVLPDGFRFERVLSISGDGRTFGGVGSLAGQNLYPGFVVTIPAPASGLLFAFAAAARRRRTPHIRGNP